MLSRKISNLSDSLVCYELMLRKVPIERTTVRSRKMLLLTILKKESNGPSLVSRSHVPPFREDFKLCVEEYEKAKRHTMDGSSAEMEIWLDRLDFLKSRLDRYEVTGSESILRKNLMLDIIELIRNLSDRGATGIDLSSSTREEEEEINEILENLEINNSRDNDYWEDAIASPSFLGQERMQSDYARLVQRDLATAHPNSPFMHTIPDPTGSLPTTMPQSSLRSIPTVSLPTTMTQSLLRPNPTVSQPTTMTQSWLRPNTALSQPITTTQSSLIPNSSVSQPTTVAHTTRNAPLPPPPPPPRIQTAPLGTQSTTLPTCQ
jgi:hypothetical protein